MSQPAVTDTANFAKPTVHKMIIAVCLALSFLDMLLLSSALEQLLDKDQVTASVLAFFLALIGSGTAFLWGRAEALHKKRSVWGYHEFWIWLLICIMFFAIRGIVIAMDLQDFPDQVFSMVSSEVLMAILLAILYVGTGLVVKNESRKIFDPVLYSAWRNRASAKQLQGTIARKFAEAERLIIELENFQKNYRALNKQYIVRRNALVDAERTTLSSVVKNVLEDNPHLSPQVVEDILQSILKERQGRNQRSKIE